MKIEFKQITGTRYFGGYTESGSTLTYNFVYEDKMKLYHSDKDAEAPTRMTMECNFDLTTAMLDLCEQSKIMHVLEKTFDEDRRFSTLVYYPRSGFSYEKLQDVIVDICEKYNL